MTKVAYFNIKNGTIVVYTEEKVVKFDIAVDYFILMTVLQSLHSLMKYLLNLIFRNIGTMLVQKHSAIHIHVFHDKTNVPRLVIHIDERNDVWMIQLM